MGGLSFKQALRKDLLAQRDGLLHREERSQKIRQQVCQLPSYGRVRNLLLYLSKGSEVDTWPLLELALEEGKAVYAPLCLDGDGSMAFYRVRSREDLRAGRFGLWEPDPARCAPLEPNALGLCLVPGLSFDKQGYRLGYGKGYYDRFLTRWEGEAVGLCFEDLLLPRLPQDPQDQRVSTVVTEAGARPCL